MTERAPVFHLLAGPNGAGKTTLYRALVADGVIHEALEFVNADHYERHHLRHIMDAQQRSEAARQWADARRASLLKAGQSFVSETVFSHASKLALIQDAQAHGFMVALYAVALDDPQRLLQRVRQRVKEGGHDVPAERILSRYPRTLANLALAVRVADAAYLYDAREVEAGGLQLVAVCQGAQTRQMASLPPAWVRQLLGDTSR